MAAFRRMINCGSSPICIWHMQKLPDENNSAMSAQTGIKQQLFLQKYSFGSGLGGRGAGFGFLSGFCFSNKDMVEKKT